MCVAMALIIKVARTMLLAPADDDTGSLKSLNTGAPVDTFGLLEDIYIQASNVMH